MKRILMSVVVLAGLGAFLLVAGGASNQSAAGTYKIQLDNAFGLVTGADFKIAGVPAGTINSIDLPTGCLKGDPTKCYAQVTVQVTQDGFGPFRSDAFCQSRPQSLIGEYFVDCQPGHSGTVLKPGSIIPVNRTQSTIPADLLANVMRMPYRERFTLIINELGAAVAGRSTDLADALRRAVPAIDQTDNLLNVLANDSHTIQMLTASSNQVITTLANNSTNVERFITEAARLSTDTASQNTNLQATFQRLPGFLEQLRPAMQQLGATADANLPVLRNLHTAAGQLNRLFTDLPGFSNSALPALRSLGKASVTGKQAVKAATPTIADLNAFAKPAPELAQNLAIVLHDLDNRSRAVEKDSRSPGGQGYTGIEALLQYVFNQTLAINQFTQFGHILAVDIFIDPRCSPYTTPNIGMNSLTNDLKNFGPNYRQCYAWLGPNQPGINETDPTNPTACVPDPGGAPPGELGPKTTAVKCTTPQAAKDVRSSTTRQVSNTSTAPAAATSQPSAQSGASPPTAAGAPASSSSSSASSAPVGGSGGSATNQAQQLLNYLLAP